jgi:hypothetical protein
LQLADKDPRAQKIVARPEGCLGLQFLTDVVEIPFDTTGCIMRDGIALGEGAGN